MGVDSASWYTKWCEPIIWSLYLRDRDQIIANISSAHEALAASGQDDHAACCLAHQVTYLEFQAQPILLGDNWKQEVDIEGFVTILGRPCRQRDAEQLRRRLYLQLRLKMDRSNIKDLEPNEMRELLDALPDEENTTEVWLYLAEWAFRHGHNEILSRAYEFSVTTARGFQHEWNWRRVDTMWRIVNNTATRENIEWLIKSATIYQQIDSLKRDILTRAEVLGLMDESLMQLIDARRAELVKHTDERVTKLLKPHTQNMDVTDLKHFHAKDP